MRLKRLSASFGVLQNSRLELKPGLNIITAPNEKGKSTWCAFIRAMLYGINTSERDKGGFLSEKTKFRPWSGRPMEGIMELEAEGRSIAIQRTALGPAPMRRLDVRYSGTGEEVTSLMHENLGEDLTGVPEAVFARSAFIRQAGLKVSQTGQLEQRIAALVSTGEEGLSYSDTAYILGVWLRKRKHNKTGQIPALESESRALNALLHRLEDASGHYNELSLHLDRALARVEELRADLSAHTELERRDRRQEIATAKKKLKDLETEISALKKELTRDGKQISKELIHEARENYDQLGARTMVYTEVKAAKESAERDLLLIQEEMIASPFEGRNLEEAKELVEAVKEKAAAAFAAEDYNRAKYTLPLAILPVLALGALTLSFMTGLPLYWLAIPAFFGTLIFAMLFYRKWMAAKIATGRREESFMRLRVGNLEDLQKVLEDYALLAARAEQLEKGFAEADQVAEKAMEEMQELRDRFETAVRSFAPGVGDLAEVFAAMSEMGKVVDRLEVARRERDALVSLLSTLTAQYEGDWDAPIPKDGLSLPRRGKGETSYELKRAERELDELKTQYDRGFGEVRALGDPLVLGAKQGMLSQRLVDLTQQYEALSLAQEVLAEADTELASRFSPLLGQRAGYYLDRLTAGQYKRVIFDKQLNPSAERKGESVSRDILYLSGGTADQIYLALRLAICDLTLPPEKICPLILDDALVSFDEQRMEKALLLFKELSKQRQILLFSCHEREAKFFARDKSVHTVSL